MNIIIHPDENTSDDDFALFGRVAKSVYRKRMSGEAKEGDISGIELTFPDGSKKTFGVRHNKASISIYPPYIYPKNTDVA